MIEHLSEDVSASIDDLIASHSHFLAALDCGIDVQRAIKSAYGWDLELVDAQMALAQIDQIVIRRLNDFVSSRSRPTILDCGANIGISVLHYKRRFPGARIIAFEPDSSICDVLRRNLLGNGAADVEVVEAAVWTRNGQASFMPTGTDGGRIEIEASREAGARLVKTVDLRDYLNTPIDLLKLDIEGAEFDVIHDLRGRLTDVANLIIECHITQRALPSFGRLISDVQEHGFELSLNTFGQWRDLIRRSAVVPPYSEQYVALYAWRPDAGYPRSESSYLPYLDLPLLIEFCRAHNRRAAPEFYERLTLDGAPEWAGAAIPLEGPYVSDGGFAWRVALPELFPSGDDDRRPTGSRLVLLEDGRPIGPPHTQHAHIRKFGAGRFSHWRNTLYFSTTDDTDPNANGSSYTIALDDGPHGGAV